MHKRSQPAATPEAIYAELVMLCRYVDSLQKERARLAGRLQPFDDEKQPRGRPWIDDVPMSMPAAPKDAMGILRQVAGQVDGLERDLAAVRAKMDQISNDAWSRDDMKPYLDKRSR